MEQQTEQFEFDFDFETVKPQIVRQASDEFQLHMGDFDGPLDLLLYLIRREEANIFDIPIARITDEYLKYISVLEKFDVAVAAEFLVMAATLIEIKSRMLLPVEPSDEEEEELKLPAPADEDSSKAEEKVDEDTSKTEEDTSPEPTKEKAKPAPEKPAQAAANKAKAPPKPRGRPRGRKTKRK